MLELDLARTRRRSASRGGAVALAVLGLLATALPAGTAADAVLTLTSPPQAARSADAPPTVVRALTIPSVSGGAAGRARTAEPVVAELDRTATGSYSMVGVTWKAGTAEPGTEVQVATRSGGAWSAYEELEAEEDPTAVAGSNSRGGTAPLWVDKADGVAVRVISSTGRAPSDLAVTTVAPGEPTAADSVAVAGADPGARIKGPVRFPKQPDVISRREWGADPRLGDECFEPVYGSSVRAVVLHHTVNSNDYSRSDAPAIVRSILAYHTQGQGWCDIGYNFLVDRFGRIYQGRRGGVRLPVRGAHAGDYNTDTAGISMIGDYDKAAPTRPMKNALVRLIGWRLGTSYAPVYGRTFIHDRRLPRLVAHGNVMSTACPGRYGYEMLPTLRRRVQWYLSAYRSPIERRADRLGRATTGPVFIGETPTRNGFVTTFTNGQMLAKKPLGAHWLTGRILGAYQSFGGRRRLGFPMTDVLEVAGTRVSRMVFERGRLYKTGAQRPRLLSGRVLVRWLKLGSVRGSLGAPTSSIHASRTHETAAFRHGRITWRKRDNRVIVRRT
jgi:hypothetical protein